MTVSEYNRLNIWDIIKHNTNYVILIKKDDNTCELYYLSGFISCIPKNKLLTDEYVYLENSKFQPSYAMIYRFLELYKSYDENKKEGQSPSMFIYDNFNKS